MNIQYEQLSQNAIKARNRNECITNMIAVLIIGALLFCTYHFQWWDWLTYVWIGLIALTIVSSVWTLLFGSKLFYKTFRYAITDDFLYIKSGVFTHNEVVIPMTKIQSIELTQGAIMRKLNVSEVQVATMQDEHSIPYLDDMIAKQVRDNIAKLARLKELDAV